MANLMKVAHTLDVVAIVNADQSVREAPTDMVFSVGYVPEPFESAEGFLKSGRSITPCLIADMQSSPMSSLALIDHLVASGGAIPTVPLTGRSEHDVRRGPGLQFSSKPFEGSELLACVRSQITNRNDAL
ncbi:response regulator [Bradyrhizobium canariense]|uniref:response regulator n=1 Tax=Bradyrhizobium canariense TaxID=255045 RepID=UPI001FDABC65|nr:response regulator [Bradyrhizobium canariense]